MQSWSPAFLPDENQCVKIPETHYANTKSHCVTFLAYDDPLGKSHSCMSLSLFSLTAIVLGVFQKHRDTRIVKANTWDLSYILLSTLTLCFLCPLPFLDILAQSPVSCRKILCSSVHCGSFHCAAQNSHCTYSLQDHHPRENEEVVADLGF